MRFPAPSPGMLGLLCISFLVHSCCFVSGVALEAQLVFQRGWANGFFCWGEGVFCGTLALPFCLWIAMWVTKRRCNGILQAGLPMRVQQTRPARPAQPAQAAQPASQPIHPSSPYDEFHQVCHSGRPAHPFQNTPAPSAANPVQLHQPGNPVRDNPILSWDVFLHPLQGP